MTTPLIGISLALFSLFHDFVLRRFFFCHQPLKEKKYRRAGTLNLQTTTGCVVIDDMVGTRSPDPQPLTLHNVSEIKFYNSTTRNRNDDSVALDLGLDYQFTSLACPFNLSTYILSCGSLFRERKDNAGCTPRLKFELHTIRVFCSCQSTLGMESNVLSKMCRVKSCGSHLLPGVPILHMSIIHFYPSASCCHNTLLLQPFQLFL